MKQFQFIASILMGLAACLWLQSCGKSPEVVKDSTNSKSGKLVLTGSSTVAPLVAEIGKRFESKHRGVRVDVQSGGSSRGITDVRQGLADIGMVSRALKDEEKDLQGFTIARDGVGIIVHKDNLVQSLSDEQVVSIYTGKVTNWEELNLFDGELNLFFEGAYLGKSLLDLQSASDTLDISLGKDKGIVIQRKKLKEFR